MAPGIVPFRGLENPNEKDMEMALRKSLGCVVPDKAWICPDTSFANRCHLSIDRWLQPLMTVTLLFRKALSSKR